QEAPRDGGEVLDRLRDGRQIGPQREHPVEIVEADDRDVARDVEAEAARSLDRGERADGGEGEDRGRPVGAMQVHFDRAAQAFEIVSAVDDPLAALEAGLAEGAASAGDALRDVLMMP